MAFTSPKNSSAAAGIANSNTTMSGSSDRTGLTIDLHCDALHVPVSTPNVSAKDFVASESVSVAEMLPPNMTIRELSTIDPERLLQLSGKTDDMDVVNHLPFCIELAKRHIQQAETLQFSSSPCPFSSRSSLTRHFSPPISPRHTGVQAADSGSSSSAAGSLSNNPQSSKCNPLTRMFLRRTFSENPRRNRTPSCNLGASAGSALLKTSGFGQSRSPGLSHCSFGHELSNLVRLGGAAFGQSAPCLYSSRDSESNRDFLTNQSGRHRSETARQSCHASGGGVLSARNDSATSTGTSPMESPKPFGQSGHFTSGFSRYSNGHRRWSVASLPGSSGYATEPGGVGSDGTSSIYTSNEGLPASPGLGPAVGGSQIVVVVGSGASASGGGGGGGATASRQRHHTTSVLSSHNSPITTSGGSLLSPRASGMSAFSSSDSNPVFDLAADLSPISRAKLTRKHSTPSLCSLADDDVAILNSVYQECFPRAKCIMEERLRSLIAQEKANPIGMPEFMDGAFCFVHGQALQLADDCLQASEKNQLSAQQFANLSSNLGQLAKQAKEKCPLSARRLHGIIINILMAIARCARLCECLEFSPEAFNRLSGDGHLDNQGQGIISQVQADVYRYVTDQLGDLVPPEFGPGDDTLFNTSLTRSGRRGSNYSNKSRAISESGSGAAPKNSVPPTPKVPAIAAPCEDDFEVVKNISNGAYGAVFLVRQKRTGHRFAMKRINKRCLALHNQCEQIWAERNILTFADNPFVVQMYCSFETPKHFCMVMEYVQGGDVASLLKKVRTIPVDLARVYFAEIVLALAYLHSYGIIHRDIKPENLLITATGHIKLTDFGLSKIGLMNRTTNFYVTTEPSASGSFSASLSSLSGERLFKDKQVYGTPQYIAPEVILGQDYGKAVDWWSVGVVLYECLLGVTPFYGSTPHDVFHMIVYHENIEWPDDPDDPLYPTDDSRDLIENLLQNDPETRLGSGVGGAEDVKGHAFFDSVNWTAVLWRKAEMLFVPQLDDEEDTGYFDTRADRYSHDDTAADHDAMQQADLVFPPATGGSPFDSPLIRSRVGSMAESSSTFEKSSTHSLTVGVSSTTSGSTTTTTGADSHQQQQQTLALDASPAQMAAVAASTTPPMQDLSMFQSFCSFSPRYARESLSLISSSGDSSPVLASSLSTADLSPSLSSSTNRLPISSQVTVQCASPEVVSNTTLPSTSDIGDNNNNNNNANNNANNDADDGGDDNDNDKTACPESVATTIVAAPDASDLATTRAVEANPSSISLPVPVISINTSQTGTTPPAKASSARPNILSVAATQVAASQTSRVRKGVGGATGSSSNRPSGLPPPSSTPHNSSKPLSLLIPTSTQPPRHHNATTGFTSSSPLSDNHRISGGSEGSSSSISSSLSPGSLSGAVPLNLGQAPVTIKRGPRGFGFTFRTVRIREPIPSGTPSGQSPRVGPRRRCRLQHQILSVQPNSPAAAASLQPGHVIMSINDVPVDGHAHVDVLTRLVGSKAEVTVYTCDTDTASVIRATPGFLTGNRAAARKQYQLSHTAFTTVGSRNGPTTTPATTVVNRKSFDPAAKSRHNLVRQASMTTPEGRSSVDNKTIVSHMENESKRTSNMSVPHVKLPTASGRPSSIGTRPSLSGCTRLASSFSGSPSGSLKMQRASSQTMLPGATGGGGVGSNIRRVSSSTTPNRPQQLLSIPTTPAGGSTGNLLSSSLPQGTLSQALSSSLGGHGRPRNLRQLSHQPSPSHQHHHHHSQRQQNSSASTLHPPTVTKPGGGGSGDQNCLPATGGTAVSRRRSFHTMPSPLARTPSPLTSYSPTTGNSLLSSSAAPASSTGGPNSGVSASLPINPISPQRACSPLVQEPGGSLRMRNMANRRVQSVYVPHYTVCDGSASQTPQTPRDILASESSSSTSLAASDLDSSSNGTFLTASTGAGGSLLERKSESCISTTNASATSVRRRLTTDDGCWPSSSRREASGGDGEAVVVVVDSVDDDDDDDDDDINKKNEEKN